MVLALSPTMPGAASASHVHPKGGEPLYVPLVPAYRLCATPNGTHGAPLSSLSCRPPVQSSNFLTFGTPDANSAPVNATGHIRLEAVSAPADVLFRLALKDVRCRPATNTSVCPGPNAQDGPDYAGQLLAQFTNRQTDHYNGPALNEAATVVDLPFPVAATCAATADSGTGGRCAATTTFNAVIPGAVKDAQRAVWQLDQIYVYDAGPDGDNATADQTVFAFEGVFVP